MTATTIPVTGGDDGVRGVSVPGDLVLDVAGLTVTFARSVLRGVDVAVRAGECVAVVGGSGAGKSVLARTLVGLADDGGGPIRRARVFADRFQLLGRDASSFGTRQWRAARGRDVGLVLQDALGSLDPLRTVGAEVAEPLAIRRPRDDSSRPNPFLPRGARSPQVLAALERSGLSNPRIRIRQRSGQLSGGMRQRALIASALVTDPPLLIADEPTTALDSTVAARVLTLLGDLRDRGTGVLLISHDLGAVARIADRVVVLDEGRVVESGPTRRVFTRPEHPATRSLVAAAALPSGPGFVAPPGPPVLTARGLCRGFPLPRGGWTTAVDQVDLELRDGEAVGVVGESGSGKTTLLRLLLAADQPDCGEVLLAGRPWSTLPERERRNSRRPVRWVPQDPLASVDPRLTVRAVLRDARRLVGTSMPRADQLSEGRDSTPMPWLTASDSRTAAQALLDAVHLPGEVLDRRLRTLSGGQRQRVAIARALATGPRVLILDEPVSALDAQVQAAVLELLVELRRRTGLTLLLVSHDLAVIQRVCDRVLVMSQGQVVDSGPVAGVFRSPQSRVTADLLAARNFASHAPSNSS